MTGAAKGGNGLPTGLRAVGYVRVSTEEQAQEGYSQAAQERAIRAQAVAKGWRMARVVVEQGTGKTLVRAGLQEALGAVQRGEAQVLVIWKLDRLSRKTRHILELVDDVFTDNGAFLVSVTESIDSTTPGGRFVLTILAGLAQMEREQLSERVRFGMAEAKRQGKHISRPPFGSRVDKRSGKLAPVEAEARERAEVMEYARAHGLRAASRRFSRSVSTVWRWIRASGV